MDDDALAVLRGLRRRGFALAVSPDDPGRLRATPPPEVEGDVRAIVAHKPALLDRLRRERRLLEAGERLGYPELAWTAQGAALPAGEGAWRATVPGLHPVLQGGLTGVAARRAAGLGPGDRRALGEAADDPALEAKPEGGTTR